MKPSSQQSQSQKIKSKKKMSVRKGYKIKIDINPS